MKSVKQAVIVLAALAGVSMMAEVSLAQQRVGSDGHALDANNRVGSGGVNTTPNRPQNLSTNVQTGNITGNGYWRGANPLVDPNTLFLNNLPGSEVDRFIARSGGYSVGGMYNPPSNGPQPFYGVHSTSTPPPGFVTNDSHSGFVPAPPPTYQPEDLRLNTGFTTIPAIPAPGQFNLPGQVDPSAGQVTASPLYGIRQWTPEQANDVFSAQRPIGPEQQAAIQQNQIEQIRQQLQTTDTTNNGQIQTQTQPLPPVGQLQPGSSGQAPLPPLTVGANQAIAPQSMSPLPGDASTGQSVRQFLPANLIPPGQQSPQYQQLVQQLKDIEAKNAGATDEQANRDFRNAMQRIKAMRAQQNAPEKPAGSSIPSTNPSASFPVTPAAPVGTLQPVTPPNQAPKPVEIKSIGADVKSTALADLLTTAEDQIRHQQYSKAIDSYNTAGEAAPNNALIIMGRSHAELGGEYYRQAEADIRDAYSKNHEVLLAQFDLADLFGQKRLEQIVVDLTAKAKESPTNPTPEILLAYISYNSGSSDKALVYLNEADQRGGGKDAVVGLMKKYWALTPNAPATQPTKEGGANIPLKLH